MDYIERDMAEITKKLIDEIIKLMMFTLNPIYKISFNIGIISFISEVPSTPLLKFEEIDSKLFIWS